MKQTVRRNWMKKWQKNSQKFDFRCKMAKFSKLYVRIIKNHSAKSVKLIEKCPNLLKNTQMTQKCPQLVKITAKKCWKLPKITQNCPQWLKITQIAQNCLKTVPKRVNVAQNPPKCYDNDNGRESVKKKIQKRTIDCSFWAWPTHPLLFAFEKFSIVGKSNFLGANSNFCRCASKYATKYCILMGIFVVSSCCRQNYCKKVESKNQLFAYPLTPPPTIVREQLPGQRKKSQLFALGLTTTPHLVREHILCDVY